MHQCLHHLQPDEAGADDDGFLLAAILHRGLQRQAIGQTAQAEHPLLLQAGDRRHLLAGAGGDHQAIVMVAEAVAVVLDPQGLILGIQRQHPVAGLDLDPLGGELRRGELGHVAGLLEVVADEVGQPAGPEGDHLGGLIDHNLGILGQTASLGGRTHAGGFATYDHNTHCLTPVTTGEASPPLIDQLPGNGSRGWVRPRTLRRPG
ncbi:hypothetical protein D3C79_726170 [compost metagenome]